MISEVPWLMHSNLQQGISKPHGALLGRIPFPPHPRHVFPIRVPQRLPILETS
jgi:hypothetical protein